MEGDRRGDAGGGGLEALTLSVAIARPWRALYEALWRPESFSNWASGLGRSPLVPDGGWWRTEGPDGPIRVRFTDHNAFGVMDHRVETGGGSIDVPMRVVPNGDGAEVMLTLFRQPGTTEARFRADAEWVRRDLDALRALFTP